MESDVGQYSFSCLHVVSCLFAWFHVASHSFMSLRVVSCLCMVSCLRVVLSSRGFMSSSRFDIFVLLSDLRVVFRSSRCFQIFASPSCPTDSGVFPQYSFSCLRVVSCLPVVSCLRVISCLRVGLISSCCFQIFALFSDLRVALVSNGQRRFPANFYSLPLHLVNVEPNPSDMRCHSRQYSTVPYFIKWYLYP